MTQVSHELDGDDHIRIQGQGAFLVLESMPEFPLAPPHIGEQITAWGVVRHDGLHNWWELHPLVGWEPGNVAAPAGAGYGIERLTANRPLEPRAHGNFMGGDEPRDRRSHTVRAADDQEP